MNYTKLITENSHELIVCSMNKVHTISHLSFTKEGHDYLFEKKGLIAVSGLPGHSNIELMADMHGGNNKLKLNDLGSTSSSYLRMYLRTWGGYFQIAGVFQDCGEANRFMEDRPDTALADSTKIQKLDEQLHFICALEKAKVAIK